MILNKSGPMGHDSRTGKCWARFWTVGFGHRTQPPPQFSAICPSVLVRPMSRRRPAWAPAASSQYWASHILRATARTISL